MTAMTGSFTIAETDASKAVTGVGFEPTAILFFHPNSDRVVDGFGASKENKAGGLGFGFAANECNQASTFPCQVYSF